ncbi:hypothetical protein J6590_005145 [Homalodisca vitripennis]|nr:hypothetical protein J6590_005145 [Homalodisca vitripennis]
MSVRLVCLVSALLLCLHASASPALNKHQTELKEHYEHLAYIAEFPCHVPQPRVLSMHALLHHTETHNKAFFPDVTVLYRCDEAAGCCTEGRHCGPLHTETVTLPFKITFLEDIEKHKKGSWIIDYYDFQNHTHCDCLEAPLTPDYPNDHTYLSSSSGSSPSYPVSSEYTPSNNQPSYSASAFYTSSQSPNSEDPWKSPNLQQFKEPPSSSSSSRVDELKENLSSSSSSSSSQELSLEDIEQLLYSAYKPEDQQVQSSRVSEVKDEKIDTPDEGLIYQKYPGASRLNGVPDTLQRQFLGAPLGGFTTIPGRPSASEIILITSLLQ